MVQVEGAGKWGTGEALLSSDLGAVVTTGLLQLPKPFFARLPPKLDPQ